ncbi:hypothetical protein [Actinoallomurus sp. NPDC052274]|uniref:hypothetical protein n=1 Tax=Actinoallomurus sp. NPDC052274 TaxID=3155420 RepID=UPI003421A190
MNTTQKRIALFTATLVASGVTIGIGIGPTFAGTADAAELPAPRVTSAAPAETPSAVTAMRCSSGVDRPWSGAGQASTYGWNTCHWAGWSVIYLYRYSNGEYRQVAHGGTYWSKFTGRTVSAKCARGNHWYVADLYQANIAGHEFNQWSNAVWLRGC